MEKCYACCIFNISVTVLMKNILKDFLHLLVGQFKTFVFFSKYVCHHLQRQYAAAGKGHIDSVDHAIIA